LGPRQRAVEAPWGLLADADLEQARGNVEKLQGIVQQRTGRSRAEVERFVAEAIEDSTSYLGRLRETLERSAHHTTQAVTQGREWVATEAGAGYEAAESALRRHPLEAVGVALGLGLVSGVAAGCLFTRR